MSEWIETEIGRYPKSWELKRLSDIINEKITYGIVQPGFHDENGVPILRVNNIREGVIDDTVVMKVSKQVAAKYSRTVLKGDEILITLVGNLGEVAIVPKKLEGWNIARAVGKIELKDKSDNNWVISWLTSKQVKHYIKTHANTTVQHTLNLSDVGNLPIILPPKKYRDELANTISVLNNKITLLREQNQTLEELVQTLFKRWFVEFEFPNDSGQPYKSSGGRMVESELGEIPEGWEVKPLSSIANYLNGLACQKYPVVDDEEKLPVLKIKELGNGINDNTDWATSNVDEKYIIESGDVIFSWSGTLMLKIWDGERSVLNQHLFKVTSDMFPDWFIFQWTNFHLNHFITVAKSKATTMGHIKRSHLDEAMCFEPTKEILDQCNGAFTKILESFKNNNEEIQSLTQLRDTLLPKLMSGELRIIEN